MPLNKTLHLIGAQVIIEKSLHKFDVWRMGAGAAGVRWGGRPGRREGRKEGNKNRSEKHV